MTSLRGRLLVASPALADPNFLRTVVLVAEHSDEGAMGLVLSRPSETSVGEAAPPLAGLVPPDDLVHVGGPVEGSAVMVLAEFDDAAESASLVFGDVGFVQADADVDEVASAVRRARVFAGYAGWGPGQLESELEDESWIVLDPEPDDVFAPASDDLWATVLGRQDGSLRLLARMPVDPSLN